MRFVQEMAFQPASLLELSARVISNYGLPFEHSGIPQHLVEYLHQARSCLNPRCRGVYFDARVEHVKFVDFCGMYRSNYFSANSSCSRFYIFVFFFTLFEIFIFFPKIQLWFPEKNCRIVLGENSWKCCVFGFFSCWQLWFHEKNCQKNIWGEKLVKMLGFCQNWIFGQKFDFSNSVS